jgi:hypothetical protein
MPRNNKNLTLETLKYKNVSTVLRQINFKHGDKRAHTGGGRGVVSPVWIQEYNYG